MNEQVQTASLSDSTKQALNNAERIAAAIGKKMPEFTHYVRLIETAEYSFVEIAFKDKKGEEYAVAYSEQFFAEVSQEKAKRVFNDVQVHLGEKS